MKAFHSVDSCRLEPGQWLAVIGCGGLGQLATQYAKAMGLKVVGLDVSDKTLEQVKAAGADVTLNTLSNKNYVEDLKILTRGGAHAAAVYTGSNIAYAHAHEVLRLNGLLMLIGIPSEPLKVDVMDMCQGKYRVQAECTSIPQRMGKAIDFTIKHGIVPQVTLHKLDEINDMIDNMRSGSATGRMAVVF